MGSMENMRGVLQKTGLYRLRGDGLVDAELAVYASELDTLRNAVSELERESFAATAQGKGLALREEQYRVNSEGKTAEERRAAILGRGEITPNSFTRAALERVCNAEGFPSRLHEYKGTQKININFINQTSYARRLKACDFVSQFFPAHLGADLDFRPLSWDTIDGGGKSFSEMDAAGLSWNGIDHFEDGLMAV